MAKFTCYCGELLRISGEIPNPIESYLISYEQAEALVELDPKEDQFDFLLPLTAVLTCPRCGRLWVFRDGWDEADVYQFEVRRDLTRPLE